MATVPGQPDNVTSMMPKALQPTQADFLQAAAIMHQQGKFAMAKPLSEQQILAPEPKSIIGNLQREEDLQTRELEGPQRKPTRGLEVEPKEIKD